MGIPESDLARLNELLAGPPDFAVTSLSSDSRLGLFVVSRLTARHGISVRLSDSDYGGTRAIVLIPSGLIEGELGAAEPRPEAMPPQRRAELAHAATASPEFRAAAASFDAWHPGQPEPDFSAPDTQVTADLRPELPRRRRQEHLAPELAEHPVPEHSPAPAPGERSAEQARELFSAIENGTRQGRQTDPGPPPAPRQEGDGEHLPRW